MARSRWRISAFLLPLAAVVTLAGHAGQAEQGDLFDNKTIAMIIGNAAGGATDVYGRIVGQYLTPHLPGTPKLVVFNQPGAEGVTALNAFVREVKPDGLTITVGAATQSDPLFYRSMKAAYDLTEFGFAGGVGRTGALLLINKKAVSRLGDPHAAPVTMGALSGVRPGMYMNLWGTGYLGWNTRWVLGYANTSDLKLALERGEIDMTSLGAIQEIKEVLATRNFQVLSQSGYLSGGRLVSRPDFSQVPLLSEQIEKRITDPVARMAFDYWRNVVLVGTWVALPPHSPQKMLKAYQTAMSEEFKDADFLEKSAAMAPDAVMMDSEEVRTLLTGLARTPPEALDYLRRLMQKQGLVIAN